jgi:hypothetical protein
MMKVIVMENLTKMVIVMSLEKEMDCLKKMEIETASSMSLLMNCSKMSWTASY